MISDRLTGKVALITGAASGVGRATAHRFATEGCAAVYLFDRNAEGLETVVAELEGMTRAVAFVGDVGIDEDCKRAVDEVVAAEGHLDIFLGNAPAHSAAAGETHQPLRSPRAVAPRPRPRPPPRRPRVAAGVKAG